MGPKADRKMFVGASPTPRCSRAGRSAAGKLLPRKCPERSLVPTKTIGSRCMDLRDYHPIPDRWHETTGSTKQVSHCTKIVHAPLVRARNQRSVTGREVRFFASPAAPSAVLSEIRPGTVVPVGMRRRTRPRHEHDGLHAADIL